MKHFSILAAALAATALAGCTPGGSGSQANTNTYTDASVGSPSASGGPKVFNARDYIPPCLGKGCKTPIPKAQLANASLKPGEAIFANVGTGTVNAFFVTPGGDFEYLSSYPREDYVNLQKPSSNDLKRLTVYAIKAPTLHVANGDVAFDTVAGSTYDLVKQPDGTFKGTYNYSDGWNNSNWSVRTGRPAQVASPEVAKK